MTWREWLRLWWGVAPEQSGIPSETDTLARIAEELQDVARRVYLLEWQATIKQHGEDPRHE